MAKNAARTRGVWSAVKAATRTAVAVATKSLTMRWSGYGGRSYGQAGGTAWGPVLRSLLPGARYDYEAEAGELWRNSAVAACLGWLRKNVCEARIKVEHRKGSEWFEVPEHPVLDWLEEPNEDYDADALFGATVLSLVVDGNAYWLKGVAASGRHGFWYVPHWQMEPRWPQDGTEFISHYEYIVDGRRIPVRKENVIHFRTGLDPLNERKGFAELKTALREVCTDNEANGYTASLLRNMGIVGVVISPESKDDTIEGDDRKELKELWRRKFTGEGRGEPLVNSVPLKITEVGATPEKMGLDKIRMLPEARICAAIGINAMVVGLSSGERQKTYKNLGEANRHAYEGCLIPLGKTILRDLQRHLKAAGVMEGRRVERLVWDYSEVPALREDQTERSKRVVIEYQGGLITKDEGRVKLGMKPAADGSGETYCMTQLRGAIPVIGNNTVDGEAA